MQLFQRESFLYSSAETEFDPSDVTLPEMTTWLESAESRGNNCRCVGMRSNTIVAACAASTHEKNPAINAICLQCAMLCSCGNADTVAYLLSAITPINQILYLFCRLDKTFHF